MVTKTEWYAKIHHIDLNPKNNEFDNLILLPGDIHRKLHYQIQKQNSPNIGLFGINQKLRSD